jgi:uncharacterized Zn finger protein
MHRLADLITETILREAAGGRAFARGVAYFRAGAVTDLVVSDDTLNARVEGGDEYAVRLWNEDGALGHFCTCPVGDDSIFCKHAVAAGLAWLADRKAASPAQRGRDDLAGIREWLAGAPREQLVDLLLGQALDDPGLRSRLDARAARVAAMQRVDVKTLKETIGKALAVSGFVDYHGMRRLIQRAYPAVELISGLIDDGHAAIAVELAHYALKRGIAAYQRIDDSGGGFGELLHQIAELHLKACRTAPPEPAAFGKQFFELLLLDDWDLLAFDDYAPLLGDAGLRAFRALAEKEWKKVPARSPGDDDARHSTSYFRITSIMEALARHAGDTDALVAIKSRDLTLPYHFLEIAELLAKAGRRDEALVWAERGRKAFPDRPDSRLTEFLADEYGRRGRHEEAIALTWEQFQQQPALASYQHLKQCCKRAGNWGEWRAKALTWLRAEVLNAGKRDRRRWSWMPHDHSLLVEIFLWEGDSDAALAEAKTGGCHESLWFAIAEAREAKYPEDAIAIYQARLDNIVKQTNNRAYDQAAALVARVRDLTRRTRQEKEFAAWLESVRIKHKAKRNFMQRIEGVP